MTYDMKVFDHIILITLVGSVSLLILSYPISPLIGSILYFALPSTYLIFRKPNILKIAIIPAFIFGFLFGIGFEYLNEVGGSWVFPLESQFVFPSFFFDTVPLDVIIWYILWVFTIICYYEYLIDRPSMPTFVSSRIYKLLALSTIALSIIAIAVYGLETDIVIPYTYTITGLISLIPVFKLYHIKLNKEGGVLRLAQTIPFLAVFFLAMEIVALTVGYWEFVGGSILTFTIAGHLLPIEEILLWIIASPLVISSYHELTISEEYQ